MVLDRLFLWVFTLACVLGTALIILHMMRPWVCRLCGESYLHLDLALRHVFTIHSGHDHLVKDIMAVHRPRVSPTPQLPVVPTNISTEGIHCNRPTIQCKMCGKKMARNDHLARHMRTVHRPGVRPTPQVPVVPTNIGTEGIHSNRPTIRCKVCGKKMARNDHLARHMRTVHRPGVRPAPQLPVVPTNIDNAGIHNNHPTIRCKVCGKKMSRNDHLARHMKTVHRPRVRPAPKLPVVPTNIDTAGIHSNHPTIQCKVCGKKMARNDHLALHMKIVHRPGVRPAPKPPVFPTNIGTPEGTNIKKRWDSLRTCFSRELRAQTSTKSGQAGSKRRKYIYFDRLLFLLPEVEHRLTASNLEIPENTQRVIEDSVYSDIERDYDAEVQDTQNLEGNNSNRDEELLETRPDRAKKNKKPSYEEELLNLLNNKQRGVEVQDEETNFALSLVPTLKKLPEDNKLQAHIEMLNVLQKFKYVQPVPPSVPPTVEKNQQFNSG